MYRHRIMVLTPAQVLACHCNSDSEKPRSIHLLFSLTSLSTNLLLQATATYLPSSQDLARIIHRHQPTLSNAPYHGPDLSRMSFRPKLLVSSCRTACRRAPD
ncbi:hypothetical protein HDK77DRAFT_232231 [Phyllosticta capitalensis]